MSLVARLIVGVLLVSTLLPTPTAAQFIPAGEVASLGTASEQESLQKVLDALAKKNDAARKRVLIVLSSLDAKKIGASNARRQVDGIIGTVKVELNSILADYSRKTPPPNSLREAYKVAQTYLNDLREMTDDAVIADETNKKLNPEAPTGKYLDHQKKIQLLVDKALEKADERLAERGKKDTVRRDLEQIVKDTQRQIDTTTAGYLLENPDVLESALKRVNTAALEGLSEQMASRFKTANTRSSDKENDLNDEENETFVGIKQEMTDIVDRTITSIDSLIRQVLSANLPAASQEPGVNPLLQAKFKTQKQMNDIVAAATERINKLNIRAGQEPEHSALLKEVITREATRQKQRLTDAHKEYEANFLAGDPTKQKYNKRKDRIQDEAAGCTSFLCNIGRTVAGVGSGLIAGATNGAVRIDPKLFSQGMFGIKDPNPYAGSPYGSSYFAGAPSLPYVGGRYVTPGAFGSQNLGYDQRCFVQAGSAKNLVLIEKAFAEGEFQSPQDLEEAGALGGTGTAPQASSVTLPGTANDFLNILDSAPKTTTGTGGATATAPRPQATQQPSLWQRSLMFMTGGTYGGISVGGTPGFNPNSQLLNCPPGTIGYQRATSGLASGGLGQVFGGRPIGPMIFGTSNDNLRLNIGANYAKDLANGFRILALQNPAYNDAAAFVEAFPMDTERLMALTTKLQSLGFYSLQQSLRDPVANMFVNLCATVVGGNQQMISLCRSIISVNGTALGSGQPNQQIISTVESQLDGAVKQLEGITANLTQACSSSNIQMVAVVKRARQSIFSNQNYLAVASVLQSKLVQLDGLISTIEKRYTEDQTCANNYRTALAAAGLGSLSPAAATSGPQVDPLVEDLKTLTDIWSYANGDPCNTIWITYFAGTRARFADRVKALGQGAARNLTAQQASFYQELQGRIKDLERLYENSPACVAEYRAAIGVRSAPGTRVTIVPGKAKLVVTIDPNYHAKQDEPSNLRYTVSVVKKGQPDYTGAPMDSVPVALGETKTPDLEPGVTYKYFYAMRRVNSANEVTSGVSVPGEFTPQANQTWCLVVPYPLALCQ